MQPSDRIARRIRLHDLHVLMTVVQAGSMNKAAKLLNTTQPAVSKMIAELEHTVGVRLLDRHRQGVEPTRYGHVVLDGGVAVFDDLRQTLQNIAFLDDPATAKVLNRRGTATCYSMGVSRSSTTFARPCRTSRFSTIRRPATFGSDAALRWPPALCPPSLIESHGSFHVSRLSSCPRRERSFFPICTNASSIY